MARITDRLLVQRVDGLIVLIDESSGEEVTVPVEVVPNVIEAMKYLTQDANARTD
jgi:hypothetical protein